MAPAPFNRFNSFTEAVAEKVHNLGSDALKVMLVNSPAPSATNTRKSDLTEITANADYTAGGKAATITSSAQTGGTYKLVLGDVAWGPATVAWTSSPFRYAVLYNDSATNKELIGWWDNGAAVTLAIGESYTVDFDPTTGVLTMVLT